MARSFFHRITRYRPSVAIDPAENRLTEAFASVIERVQGLGADLLESWGEAVAIDTPVAVRTQRTTLSGGYVDLELRFGELAAPDLLVWVEVKHGAGLHGEQLRIYAHDIATELATEKRLMLLAPRASMPAAAAGFIPIEWQAVARQMQRWLKAEPRDPVDAWLVGEFISFLKEEGLADEETLSAAHAFAFAARPAADRAIGRAIELADLYVVAHWGPRKDYAKRGNKPAYGPGWYCNHEVVPSSEQAPPTWRATHFEWTLREDSSNPDGRDAFAFCAGATFEKTKDNPSTVTANQPWLAGHREQGFERVQDWYWRLWRFLYPEELLVERSLDQQGERLGRWVVESFQLLASTPPPN